MPDILEELRAPYGWCSRAMRARAAGEGVVKWWLDEGCLPFDGAPHALFALRNALGDSRDKAALGESDES